MGAAGALQERGLGPNDDRDLLEREYGHCEAVQCRSLGLSLSSGRGHELTHTSDCSHRRTCCHHEYKPLLCFNFLCFLSCCHILYVYYYTRSTDYMGRHDRRTHSWREPRSRSTIPHVSCIVVFDHVMSSFFTKPIMRCLQYSSGPISVNTPGLDHEVETPSMNTDIMYKITQHLQTKSGLQEYERQ